MPAKKKPVVRDIDEDIKNSRYDEDERETRRQRALKTNEAAKKKKGAKEPKRFFDRLLGR